MASVTTPHTMHRPRGGRGHLFLRRVRSVCLRNLLEIELLDALHLHIRLQFTAGIFCQIVQTLTARQHKVAQLAHTSSRGHGARAHQRGMGAFDARTTPPAVVIIVVEGGAITVRQLGDLLVLLVLSRTRPVIHRGLWRSHRPHGACDLLCRLLWHNEADEDRNETENGTNQAAVTVDLLFELVSQRPGLSVWRSAAQLGSQ